MLLSQGLQRWGVGEKEQQVRVFELRYFGFSLILPAGPPPAVFGQCSLVCSRVKNSPDFLPLSLMGGSK